MDIQVSASKLRGTVKVPPSKSHTLRAILFASMSNGISTVRNPLSSPDTEAMIRACEKMGAEFERKNDSISVKGCGKIQVPENTVIDAGNSGQVLRFIAALAAIGEHTFTVTGDASICTNRPVGALLDGLEQLGAEVLSSNGHAPIKVRGPIYPGSIEIDGEDSQPVSGLLIAAAFLPGETEIRVRNPGELPWVDLTLTWFDRLGIEYSRKGHEYYRVKGNTTLQAFDYTVPGDFSSAAYPLAAALVTKSSLMLENLDLEDAQGDKAILSVLEEMGAVFEVDSSKKTVRILPCSELRGVDVDINHFIDSITILSVLACYAQGRTKIRNAAIARCKESDRIAVMAKELRAMGAVLKETPDGLELHESLLKGTKMYGHKDHRVAMSLAVAAMGAEGPSYISGAECIAKSYGDFIRDFQALGAELEACS